MAFVSYGNSAPLIVHQIGVSSLWLSYAREIVVLQLYRQQMCFKFQAYGFRILGKLSNSGPRKYTNIDQDSNADIVDVVTQIH